MERRGSELCPIDLSDDDAPVKSNKKSKKKTKRKRERERLSTLSNSCIGADNVNENNITESSLLLKRLDSIEEKLQSAQTVPESTACQTQSDVNQLSSQCDGLEHRLDNIESFLKHLAQAFNGSGFQSRHDVLAEATCTAESSPQINPTPVFGKKDLLRNSIDLVEDTDERNKTVSPGVASNSISENIVLPNSDDVKFHESFDCDSPQMLPTANFISTDFVPEVYEAVATGQEMPGASESTTCDPKVNVAFDHEILGRSEYNSTDSDLRVNAAVDHEILGASEYNSTNCGPDVNDLFGHEMLVRSDISSTNCDPKVNESFVHETLTTTCNSVGAEPPQEHVLTGHNDNEYLEQPMPLPPIMPVKEEINYLRDDQGRILMYLYCAAKRINKSSSRISAVSGMYLTDTLHNEFPFQSDRGLTEVKIEAEIRAALCGIEVIKDTFSSLADVCVMIISSCSWTPFVKVMKSDNAYPGFYRCSCNVRDCEHSQDRWQTDSYLGKTQIDVLPQLMLSKKELKVHWCKSDQISEEEKTILSAYKLVVEGVLHEINEIINLPGIELMSVQN